MLVCQKGQDRVTTAMVAMWLPGEEGSHHERKTEIMNEDRTGVTNKAL